MENKNDVKIMLKEAGILFAITLVAGLLLGFIYQLTKEPIHQQEILAINKACAAVFDSADSFDEITFAPDSQLLDTMQETGVKLGTVYQAKDSSGSLLGYVIQSTSSEGYGGNITLYVGVALDGTLNDISILTISETAGLGMQAGDVLVPQFHDKQVDTFTYTKTGSTSDSEIDAISGATITTKAVTNAVNAGLAAAKQLIAMDGGAVNE